MNEKALRLLEFPKIREMLSTYAATNIGSALCLQLPVHSTLDQVKRLQAETQEALVILTFRGDSPMVPFQDMRDALHLAQKGATLSMRMLLDIADCCRAAAAAKRALVTDRENTPILRAVAVRLEPNTGLARDITDAIISEEEMADNASPELADIRRHIRQCNDRVRDKLQSIIHSSTGSKYLQDTIVTVRNGRYVIPVRQEYRQFVPGLVHDQSASGATLFVEPLSVVEAGNELKQWQSKEHQEIERILLMLSSDVAQVADELAYNIDNLAQLDVAFAKAQMARAMNAIEPKLNADGCIRFVRVRHPLIDPAQVVPCDLWMGEDFTTLVITGPNTGGKTVTLKTVGLITLMAQAGLHVPGNLGTEIAVFDEVYADIGDEQSIEQSLSTFSSHMTNIVEILAHVEHNDLVLFDELGAGTDPTEGAALAQAILERLLKHRIRTVATTHYSELKAYALSTKGVENASVEFDVATLRPTYRLSIGVPGKSNAFEISRKLGLPGALIDAAMQLMSQESILFEDVLSNAEYHRQVAEKERQIAEEARAETVRLRDEAENLYRAIAEGKDAALRKAKEDAKKVLEKTRRESAAILEELRAAQKAGGANAATQDINRRLRVLDNSLASPEDGDGFSTHTAPKDVNVGDSVQIVDTGTTAQVIAKPDAKGEVQVQAGIIKMKVHLSRLKLVEDTLPKRKTTVRTQTGAAQRTVPMECDVRGMALDEAIAESERYIDMAVMAGLHEVSIIHGKGTGTLRSGIQKYFKKHAHVKSIRLGQFGEGESGVSIITLK
jgi:DNA mismatch repair protein MutS2